MSINQTDEVAERGIIVLSSVIYLLMVKADIIVLGGSLDGIVLGRICLNYNLSSLNSTPRSARYLTQELKSALTTAKIREIETSVGTDYPG
jgi:hypothetical protein